MSDLFSVFYRSLIRCSVVVIFFVLLFLHGCGEKPDPAVYPRIMTLPVTDIGTEGATFNVDLLDMGSQNITEFGFTWSESMNSDKNTVDRIFLEIPAGTGRFSIRVSSVLQVNKEYYVRSFIKTDDFLVYGTEIKFVSNGCLAPVITEVYPESAGWSDTITIKGDNFSFYNYNNSVYVGNVYSPVISAGNNFLKVLVPNSITTLENSVQVEVAGKKSNVPEKKIKLIKPALTDYQPHKVRWGDTLIMKGRNLKYIKFINNAVQLGGVICPEIFIYSDSCVGIKIPDEVVNISNTLKLNVGGSIINGSEPIELLSPYFDFSPKNAAIGATITLDGRFNANLTRSQVLLGTTPVKITNLTNTRIVFTIPNTHPDPYAKITYSASPFIVTSADEFRLSGPWRYIPTPSGFFYNTTSGDNNRANGVSFTLKGIGYMYSSYTSKMSSYDPANNKLTQLGYISTLEYLKGLTTIINNDTAFLLQPKDYYNSMFSFYDVSTAKWKTYGPNPSAFGYGGGFSLGGKIYYGLVRNPTETGYSNLFYVYDNKQNKWVTKASLQIGENTYVAASFAFNEIGYILFTNKKLYSYNPVSDSWKYLGIWPATGTTRFGPTVFIIDNSVYVGLGYSSGDFKVYDDIWKYDPVTNQWTEVAKIPYSGRSSVLTFVAGGKAYIGYGISRTATFTDFYEFDPSSLK
jgi:hypothetical protein